jgi:hypothetical protein
MCLLFKALSEIDRAVGYFFTYFGGDGFFSL